MRQRTCSHRISELYNEIILSAKFKDEFSRQESFYQNNTYVTIFKDKGFKAKLLIIDKESQNIIFENIWDNSFIIYNNIQEDKFLYSVNPDDSQIDKFKNPLLNNGLIEDFENRKHSFITQSIKLTDVLLKNEIIYLIGEVLAPNINKPISNFDQKIGVIDFDIFNQEYFTINFLIGINTDNLELIKGNYFTGGGNLKIWSRDFPLKNTVLIEIYNFEYAEELSYIVNYKNNIFKPIHPSFLTEISLNYMLVKPYIQSTHYGHYEDFKLIRLSDLEEIDLFNYLPTDVLEYINSLKLDSISNDSIHNQFIENDILFFGDYEFSCDNLFNLTSKIKNNHKQQEVKLKTLIPINNNEISGFALDIHTIKSTLLDDGKFETTRTDLGELLFRLKYKFDRSTIEEIAIKCSKVIKSAYSDIDVIIPAPPSNLERPFQPVFEVAKRIGELTKIPIDLNYVIKLPTEQIKSLNNQEDRNIILDRSISITDDRYKNKNVLIFDDLYRSGDTLNAISKKLLSQGKVNTVKVLCITKTRNKR